MFSTGLVWFGSYCNELCFILGPVSQKMTVFVISYWNPCFWLVISRFVTDICCLSLQKGFVKQVPGLFAVVTLEVLKYNLKKGNESQQLLNNIWIVQSEKLLSLSTHWTRWKSNETFIIMYLLTITVRSEVVLFLVNNVEVFCCCNSEIVIANICSNEKGSCCCSNEEVVISQ